MTDMEQLINVCNSGGNGLSVGEVTKATIDLMIGPLRMASAIVSLHDEKNGDTTEESHAHNEDYRGGGRYRGADGVIAHVLQTGEAAIVPPREGNHPFICVPVTNGRTTIGVVAGDCPPLPEKRLKEISSVLTIAAAIIARAVLLRNCQHEKRTEHRALLQDKTRLPDVTDYLSMLEPYGLARRIASTDVPILLIGEHGVGKQFIGRTIHECSSRSRNPFVTFNCAVLPASIGENELFGVTRIASGTAAGVRAGKVAQADGGTLYLDNVDQLGPRGQTGLLRILQEHEVEPIDGTEPMSVNVRIIAATTRNLGELVADGTFRSDLFYKLNVFPITVPSLRSHLADVMPLANFFIEQSGRELGRKVTGISTPAIDLLTSYHWPGNVQELENVARRAVRLCDTGIIQVEHLPPSLQAGGPYISDESRDSLESRLHGLEYELIVEELKRQHGNMSKAAAVLGITLHRITRRVQRYGIDPKRFRMARKSGNKMKS